MKQEELNTEFDIIRPKLKSYILRITASQTDTEDILQDTWLKAAQKLSSFRGEASLKTWIFSIATNLAKDNLRARNRWVENVTDICREAALSNPTFFQEAMNIRMQSPQGEFEIKEHIAFCFTCVSKSLPLEQHICLLLKEVYDFKVAEINQITGVSLAMVKYNLHAARTKMIEIFEGRCSLINKKGVCHQCTELNGIFNPKQKEQEELAKIKMVQLADRSDKQHLFDLRMEILKGIDPFESGAATLQLHHLEHNRKVMENYLKKNTE